MRMATHHLVGDGGRDRREAEPAGLLGQAGVVDDLEQQIAQLVLQPVQIAARDGIGDLIGLLDGVRRDGGEGLLPVPGTAGDGIAQRRHDIEQTPHGGSGGVGRAHAADSHGCRNSDRRAIRKPGGEGNAYEDGRPPSYRRRGVKLLDGRSPGVERSRLHKPIAWDARPTGARGPGSPDRPEGRNGGELPMAGTAIAIVGAGFSGTLLSLHLLRRCPPTTRIILIERNRQFGRGQAYSAPNPSHLLNVPAGRMSAFHDQPTDFLDWLQAQPAETLKDVVPAAGTFVPRELFGEYVRSLLNEEIRRAEPRDRLELMRGEVLGIDRSRHPLVLTLDRDRTVEADLAVLAVGNFPPEPMPIADPSFYDTPFYRPDPWAPDALTGLKSDVPVLLVGTGLTMVDAVASLLDQGHAGPIHALSRRGLLPRRHAAAPAVPAGEPLPFPTGVTALTRFLRDESRRALAAGGSWHAVVDELRPFTADVWQAMPIEDKRRFLRHARPWWDVHRHRMAGPVADRIEAAIASGQLRIQAGRIRAYAIEGDRVRVDFLPRGGKELAGLSGRPRGELRRAGR